MDIKGAHVFTTGTWNGIQITSATLDSLVESFAALANAGRIPLKLGHNDEQPVTDGQPALGWVTRLYRRGEALYADFSGLPGAVYDSIKKGLYKFVSIEMLRNVDADGHRYDAVLDAVALLGADRPAVTNLADLQRLAATREMQAMRFDTREAFSVEFAIRDEPTPKTKAKTPTQDFAALKTERDEYKRRAEQADRREEQYAAEKAANHTRDLKARAEELVLAGRLAPYKRDQIWAAKKLNDPKQAVKFSRDDLELYALPVGERSGYAPGLVTGKMRAPGGDDLDNPVPELALATREYAKQNNVDVFTAMGAVAKLRRDLVEPVMTQFQRSRGR